MLLGAVGQFGCGDKVAFAPVNKLEVQLTSLLWCSSLQIDEPMPARPYSLVLEELKEENNWKNDLVLFWLDESVR